MPVYRTIDELKPLLGQEAGVSDWLEITQAMVDGFADLTGDRQWIHCDARRARSESPYGGTIAHGFFTLSLVSQLHAGAVQVEGIRRLINYGLNRVRFPAAVPVGSRIRLRATLSALEQLENSWQASWAVTVEVEGQSKPALAADWLLRYFP